ACQRRIVHVFFPKKRLTVIHSSLTVGEGFIFTTSGRVMSNSNVDAARNRNITRWTQSAEKNAASDNDIGWLSSNKRDAEWEMKMRELTRQLSIFLSSMKRQQEIDESRTKSASEANDANNAFMPPPLATVRIIREGSVTQLDENEYQLTASIVLISDNGTNVLVDTGLGTNSSGRIDMLRTLSNLSIRPIDVHYVVTTHGHPDHSGNTNDFPDAFHYAGNYVYRRTRFNFSLLFEDDAESITSNIYLLKTHGHSSDDISVIVNNAATLGTVAISGDIFIREEDLTNPMIWTSMSANETQQRESRRRLLCTADYIVPGHGQIFAVTETIRRQHSCLGIV
uniref:Metallo-beta-lactamase domain-containing protein 1 n=1 Tax=Parascaris univalens TaxID=6257 RepID=A0A915A8Q5_PARUN